MLRLKVLWRTDVYEMDSIFSNAKNRSGFLKPKKIPVERKKR